MPSRSEPAPPVRGCDCRRRSNVVTQLPHLRAGITRYPRSHHDTEIGFVQKCRDFAHHNRCKPEFACSNGASHKDSPLPSPQGHRALSRTIGQPGSQGRVAPRAVFESTSAAYELSSHVTERNSCNRQMLVLALGKLFVTLMS